MSNRNPQPSKAQSKSPNIRPKESEHLKNIIQSKLITKTQPDEYEEPLDFKIEIERRFQQCQSQKVYKFQLETQSDDSLSDCDSLIGVTTYNLQAQNHKGAYIYEEYADDVTGQKLTDATQSEFVSQVNKKLLNYLRESETSIHVKTEGDLLTKADQGLKQYNYVRPQEHKRQNQSMSRDPRFEQLIHRKKDPSIDSRSTSNNKSRVEQDRHFLMQQLLKVNGTRQPKLQFENPVAKLHLKPNSSKGHSSYVKHVQPSQTNNYVNFHANFNNSVIIENQIRIRTEVDEDETPVYKANKLRQQYKQIRRPINSKEPTKLNYTMDYRFFDQMERSMESKSQNKNYQL